jgi:hypothetical protein
MLDQKVGSGDTISMQSPGPDTLPVLRLLSPRMADCQRYEGGSPGILGRSLAMARQRRKLGRIASKSQMTLE